MGRSLPDNVRRLIDERLYSVEALEVLFLLRAKPSRWWTVEDVSSHRRSEVGAAELRLQRLARANLVARDKECRYRYAPATGELRDAVDALAERYSAHKVAIATLIYQKPDHAATRFDERIGLP